MSTLHAGIEALLFSTILALYKSPSMTLHDIVTGFGRSTCVPYKDEIRCFIANCYEYEKLLRV